MNNEFTIYKIIEKINEKVPNKELFYFPEENIKYTYKKIIDEVKICAKGLISIGIKKNDHIGIWMDNISKWYIIFFACNMIGAKAIPINTSFNTFEINNAINSFDIKYLFSSSGYKNKYIPIIDNIVSNNKKIEKVITIGFEKEKCTNYNNMIKDGKIINDKAIDDYKDNTKSNDVCIILPTSGTTGFPKGVELTNKQLIKNGFDIGERYDLNKDDNMLIQVPMFHCFGITLSMLSSLTHLTKMTVISHFNPEKVLKIIEDEKITCINGVPTMYHRIIDSVNFNKTNISSLTKGIMAGSNCLPDFIEEVTKTMNMKIISVYGLSEASPGCTMSSVFDDYELRKTTVGKSLPDIECKIIDPKTNKELQDGFIGEFIVRGYNVMNGYYNNDIETKKVIDSEGFLHTGDLARKTKDGYYEITGRIKDMIIRGGENIYPKEVEMVISKIDGVINVTVFGVDDENYGQEVVAYIKTEGNVTEEDVREYMKENCARYKIPKYIVITDYMPTNEAGKILSYKMKEHFVKNNR